MMLEVLTRWPLEVNTTGIKWGNDANSGMTGKQAGQPGGCNAEPALTITTRMNHG
jgi:hypothetical protein